MSKPEIFICYQRADTNMAAGRLRDDLGEAFSREKLFRDIHNIAIGRDYREALDEALRQASIILVLIGPSWAVERLADEGDSVRHEIATALALGLNIVPILIDGAKMPRANQLPQPVAAFAYKNAFEIFESRWGDDVEKIIKHIENGGLGRVDVRRVSASKNAVFAWLTIILMTAGIPIVFGREGVIYQGQQWPVVERLFWQAAGHFLDFIQFRFALYGALPALAFQLLLAPRPLRPGPGDLLQQFVLSALISYCAVRVIYLVVPGDPLFGVEASNEMLGVLYGIGAAASVLAGLVLRWRSRQQS